MEERLPLELLREKYIPVSEFPDKYGVSVAKVMSLMNAGKIRRGEFTVPGQRKRVIHANYEEVLTEIEKEGKSS